MEEFNKSEIGQKPTVIQGLILGGLVLIIVAPVLYYGVPYFSIGPDIFYVKAKVIQVQQGNIFADPVTGYDTFHPPAYHVVLAWLVFWGLSIDFSMILITIVNVSLIIYLTFRLCSHLYDTKTAFFVCLLIPFIFEFMGSRNILLATSYNFSVPFFLGGLLLYLKSNKSYLHIALAGFVWGLAFLISPVYFFLLGLIFFRDIIVNRRWRRFFILTGVFAGTIIPFVIQAAAIISQNLHHSSTFTLWRGLPDIVFFKELFIEFLSPSVHNLLSIPALIAVTFIFAAIAIFIKRKRAMWFVPLGALAFLLTYYHFSGQYAIRIELFISIFIVAVVVDGLRALGLSNRIWLAPLILIVGVSMWAHYEDAIEDYRRVESGLEVYENVIRTLKPNLDSHLVDHEYVLCTKDTYFRYIMLYKPVHALGAYRTMKYYQLDTIVANRLEIDYWQLIQSHDYEEIVNIADKYGINAAVFCGPDRTLPVYKTLISRWPSVWWNEQFIILKRPDL
jgi:hypothetical protein